MSKALLSRQPDSDDVVKELSAGRWLVYPYEAYGQLDRTEHNDQLMQHAARYGLQVEVIDISRRSVVVVVNTANLPTFEQITESVAAVVHDRAMGRL